MLACASADARRPVFARGGCRRSQRDLLALPSALAAFAEGEPPPDEGSQILSVR